MVRILSRRRRTRIFLNVVHLYLRKQLKMEIRCRVRRRDGVCGLLSVRFFEFVATIGVEKKWHIVACLWVFISVMA